MKYIKEKIMGDIKAKIPEIDRKNRIHQLWRYGYSKKEALEIIK